MGEQEGAALRSRLRQRFAERVIAIAFVLSIVGISGVGFLAYYLLGRTQESEAWVLHTAVTISRLEATVFLYRYSSGQLPMVVLSWSQ